jgi:transmembrane sensor
VNQQINQEAAEWFVEIHSDVPDAATRKRFDKWLRTSPEHVRAFLEIVPIWEDATQLPLDVTATPEQFIARVRGTNNVVSMRAADAPQSASRAAADHESRLARRDHRDRRAVWAAGIGVIIAGAAAIWGYQSLSHPIYVTGVGEQRSLVLQDRSTVQLDARSIARIHFSKQERSVELLQGRALFVVTKDAARPFVVTSAGTRVRAVGTRFEVYRKNTGTLVTVVEGRVAVSDQWTTTAVAGSGSVSLAAGEQILIGSGTVQKVEHPDLIGATAWTQRQLAFDSTPLAEVAEEFNRYNQRRLIIDTVRIGDLRISGLFSSADPTSLIRFLRAQPGVRVVELDDGIHVSGS